MESQNPQVHQLLKDAQNWFEQISKHQVHELMAFKQLPNGLAFVLKVFYAMINNQALDKNKEFFIDVDPSQAKQFDTRKLSVNFQQLFSGFQSKSIEQTMKDFDPLKISQETTKYLRRIRIETLEGPQLELTQQRIKNTSILGNKLLNWCKCMFEIRKKVLIDEQ